MHFIFINVFSTKVLTGDTIFTSPKGDGATILRGHPRHAKISPLALQREYLLSYFKILSIGPVPGIEPATSSSAVKRSTYWANRRYAVSRLHLTEDFRLLLDNVFESIRFSSSISSIKSRRYLYDPENWKDVRRVFSDFL